MKRKFYSLIVIILVTILLGGCNDNLEKNIIGKWESQQISVQDGKTYDSILLEIKEIDFQSNGIVYLDSIDFNYKWVDGTQILIEENNGDLLNVEMKDDSLVIKHETYEIVYKKVKE